MYQQQSLCSLVCIIIKSPFNSSYCSLAWFSENCVCCLTAINDSGSGDAATPWCTCCLHAPPSRQNELEDANVQPAATVTHPQDSVTEETTASIDSTDVDAKDQVSLASLERITKELAELRVQTGLTDALPVSDNAHFDLLPVRYLIYRHIAIRTFVVPTCCGCI